MSVNLFPNYVLRPQEIKSPPPQHWLKTELLVITRAMQVLKVLYGKLSNNCSMLIQVRLVTQLLL